MSRKRKFKTFFVSWWSLIMSSLSFRISCHHSSLAVECCILFRKISIILRFSFKMNACLPESGRCTCITRHVFSIHFQFENNSNRNLFRCLFIHEFSSISSWMSPWRRQEFYFDHKTIPTSYCIPFYVWMDIPFYFSNICPAFTFLAFPTLLPWHGTIIVVCSYLPCCVCIFNVTKNLLRVSIICCLQD